MPIGQVRDYEGQSDAQTLSDAHRIRTDGKRHEKAMGHLKKMAKKSDHHAAAHAHEQQAVNMKDQTEGAPTNAAGAPGAEQAEPVEPMEGE